MRDVLEQYHGSCAAYDEALIGGDAVLAAAVWRNLFGAGWGGVGGVAGKGAPKVGEVPKYGPNPNPMAVDPIQRKALKKGVKETEFFKTDQPVVDPLRMMDVPLYPTDPDMEFVPSLEKLVVFIRQELNRLERLPEENVLSGRPEKGSGSVTGFSKIE